jgi:hypothetical protein
MGLSHQFNSAGGFDLSDPWQCLYFFPDPQTHGAFLLIAEKPFSLVAKVGKTGLGIIVATLESVSRYLLTVGIPIFAHFCSSFVLPQHAL